MTNTEKINYCINPAVIKWARIRSGYSIEQAALKLKVNPEELKSWEDGSIETPINKLKQIASIYKRPTSVFVFNSVPEENISTKFRRLLDDNEEIFTTETLMAIRQAIKIQNIAKDVLEVGNNRFLENLRRIKTVRQHDTLALKIHRLLDLSVEQIMQPKQRFAQLNMWKNAIEAKGIYIIETGFPIKEAKGIAIYDKEAPVIILNTNDPPRARIFTLLHELCHFAYEEDAIDDSFTLDSYSIGEKLETACNYLAGAILVPYVYLKQTIMDLQTDLKNELENSIDLLGRTFNVSREVVLRRLLIYKYIGQDQFNYSMSLFKKEYLTMPEYKTAGGNFYIKFVKNNSKAFIYDIFDAYRVKKITHFDVMSYLNLKSSTLSKLESRL